MAFWFLVLGWLPCAQVLRAQSDIRILSLENTGAGQLRLTFEGIVPGASNYCVEYSVALPASTWVQPTNIQIEAATGGGFFAIVPRFSDSPGFYRVACFTSGGADADEDGLADVQEALRGTDPRNPDTDKDGFSDGVEVASGTNPLSSASQPDLSVLPDASFDQAVMTVTEGDGTCSARIGLSRPFQGTLHYHVAPNSTATSTGPEWDFEPLTGTVPINGTSAAIPIHLVDDLRISGTRFLLLDIDVDPLCRYRPGGTSRQLIRIEDNDDYWTGTMRDVYATSTSTNVGYSELGFRMKLLRSGSSVQAWLVNDGKADTAVKGSGCIPVGEWPATADWSSNSFQAVSSPIPLPALPLFGNSQVARTVRLHARPDPRFLYRFGTNYIAGDYADEIRAVDRSQSYLDRTNNVGFFILVRDLPKDSGTELLSQ